MIVERVRDLSLIDIGQGKVLVIACDSCGSVGIKEGDVLKVPPYYTGRFAARVPLMEVLCSGAEIITLTNNVCAEMKPTGEELIRGIKDELMDAGVSDCVLTGSTEENFPTISTGVGVTVIGIAQHNKLKIKNADRQLAVIAAGIPKVGSEVNFEGDKDIVSYRDCIEFLKNEHVYEIVPGGSKGLYHEAHALAEENGRTFRLSDLCTVDLKKSCGPATAVIAAIDEEKIEYFLRNFKNCELIGYIF